MKPILRFLILILFIALSFDQRAAAASTLSRHTESLETTSPTPTPIPTEIISPSIKTQEAEGFKYTKNCITVEKELPADIHPEDELLLYDRERYRNRVHDFKVGYDRLSPYPANIGDFVPSPDRKWMAYTAEDYTKTRQRRNFYSGYYYEYDYYRLSSLTLEVQNAEGRKLDMSYWMVDWQYILGWLDNRHLVLSISKYPAGSVVILNPFTTEWKVFTPSLPDIGQPGPSWRGERPDYFAYNSLLTHVLYQPLLGEYSWERGSWRLYDLEEQKVLWTGGEYALSYLEPGWSPTGKHFIIFDRPDQNTTNILLIGLDGRVKTIASDVQRSYGKVFSWSPNGQKLALWLGLSEGQSSLSIVDIEEQTVTDLCLETSYNSFWDSPLMAWSPDGNFIAVGLQGQNDRSYFTVLDTVLIEVELQRAFLFREDAAPMDWMMKP